VVAIKQTGNHLLCSASSARGVAGAAEGAQIVSQPGSDRTTKIPDGGSVPAVRDYVQIIPNVQSHFSLRLIAAGSVPIFTLIREIFW